MAKKITSTLLPSMYFVTENNIKVVGSDEFAPGFALFGQLTSNYQHYDAILI